MANGDDEVGDLVKLLDPTIREAPPAPGSDRYRSILECAMHADDDAAIEVAAAPPRTSSLRRPSRVVPAIAAVAIVAVSGLVVLRSNESPTAHAAVASAAESMDEIMSLEGELTVTVPGVSDGTTRIRVDGDDVEITSETQYEDGRIETAMFVIVDGTFFETIGGRTSAVPIGPNDGLAPFGRSSASVIAAALEGSVVTVRGEERLGDVVTTRYDIDLTEASIAALSALTPGELAWFELEYPSDVTALSVWVADDLVHQVEIAQRDQFSRTRFFNFGADITITAPPGPYATSEEG